MSAAKAPNGELSHRQIMTILSGLLIGLFLAALDQTIVSTAIRTIGDDLHGLSAQAWVTTSFLITSTISTPLFGKLSDIYGRKQFYMGAIVIFIIGSALCGLATSMYMLAGFRALQGIGAGGIMPLAMAIVGDIIPPRERAKYQGYFMATFGVSAVLGPVVGGFFAGQDSILGITGWRWIFYINVPVGMVALVVVERVLRTRHVRHDHRIDWAGAGALVVALVPLLIVAEQGRTWGWASAAAFTCYVLGVVGITAFLRIESKAGNEALLPLRLFRGGTFSVASAQATVMGMAMFGGMASIPLYLQIVKGASPTKSGLLLLPLVAGLLFATMTSGQITMRTGRYKAMPVVGTVLLVVTLFSLTTVGADTSLVTVDILMALFGIGIGLNMTSLVLAMQNAVEPRDMGVATAANTFFRSVGGSLGTAVFLSILFSQAATNIPKELAKAGVAPGSAGVSLDDTSKIASLPEHVRHPVLVGFSNSMDTVFLVAGLVTLIGIVLALMMKETPLRTQSGIQAARAAKEAADRKQAEIIAAEGLAGAPEESGAEVVGARASGPSEPGPGA